MEIMCWWGAGVLLWILTVSTVGAAELVGALAAGLAGAVFARRVRRALGLRIRIPREVPGWLAGLPRTLAADIGATLGFIVRGAGNAASAGRRRNLDWPAGGSARAEGWRAAAAVLVSATPGTLVLDVDPGSGRTLVHELFPEHPAPITAAAP
ncbi:hypothetical protein [Arthrobacter sp. STN4]|nr:hypothetical protein [Arthrobacter sp. STN4]MCQ9165758.1 hypothetical protein [Arthrobacter sp. STN4]